MFDQARLVQLAGVEIWVFNLLGGGHKANDVIGSLVLHLPTTVVRVTVVGDGETMVSTSLVLYCVITTVVGVT